MPFGPSGAAIRDSARLQALRRLGLLDSPASPAFDGLTRIVRQVLGVPVALLTLVDADRQFLLSESGLAEPWASRRETKLSHSFCQHVVNSGEPFLVGHAAEHPLVCDNLAIRDLGVVAYLGMPLRTSAGHVLGALCAIDTQKRVWTEAETAILADLALLATNEIALRGLAEELEVRVRDEAAARVSAQDGMAQKRRLEALGQLAGGVAHDFANVLQSVQAGVRLADRYLESNPEKARRMLETVAEAARRGGSITRRLLGFARRGELRIETVTPASLLDDLREVLARTLNLPGLSIMVAVAADVPAVQADRGELETVLVNLATNARDAMPKGGRLTLGAAFEVIEGGRAGMPSGGYVRLSATDTGVGMDADTLARASDPFFTTKADGAGTGLGLAMARDFAMQAGGGFEIESVVGQGTTVSLWLPARGGEEPETVG